MVEVAAELVGLQPRPEDEGLVLEGGLATVEAVTVVASWLFPCYPCRSWPLLPWSLSGSVVVNLKQQTARARGLTNAYNSVHGLACLTTMPGCN